MMMGEGVAMPEPISFYFDFASPYAYLAATQIEAVADRCGRTVAWRPILLGAVFKATGSQPLLQVPLKGPYLQRDVPRFARLLHVPLHTPLPVPFAALAAARGFYWLLERGDAHRATAFALAVFQAHWADGRDMALPENVLDVAAGLEIDRAALEAGMTDPAVKQRLRQETDDAVARGVFGAPFFIVDGEPFWGVDRLPQLERWLQTGGW